MSNKINTENELTVVEGATRTAGRVKTIVVIERNLDAIKTADWIIDLGPEGGGGGGGGGGDGGGEVVAAGTPEQVAAHPHSHTGRFLAPVLGR